MATAHVGGGTLYYDTVGAGPPVLVMHGGLGWDHSYMRPWLDPLAAGATLVYYDHMGNGRSGEPAEWGVVTHATWADDADRLRAHLGHERIVVFGHSYGGFLAQEYALRYPDRVAGLILANTAPSFAHAPLAVDNARARGTPEQVAAVLGLIAAPAVDDAALAAAMRAALPLYFRRPSAAPVSEIAARMHYRAGAFNRAFFGCAATFATDDRLPTLETPTLVLGGADDWVMPAAVGAERLARLIPGAELVVFGRSGHLPFVEEPEAFCATVGAWLARVAPGEHPGRRHSAPSDTT
jgi:proline iminopeptidase